MYQTRGFEIRDYTEEDYPQLLELWELTGLGNAARGDDSTVIEQTLKIGGKLLIMKHNESFRIMGSSWMTSDGRRLNIHHFGIHPEFQGRGLSKQLMMATMEYSRKLGQQVKLEVHKSNIKAIKLYGKFGFKYLGDYQVYINRETEQRKEPINHS